MIVMGTAAADSAEGCGARLNAYWIARHAKAAALNSQTALSARGIRIDSTQAWFVETGND